MIKKCSQIVILLTVLQWRASAQDAKTAIATVAKAMGIQDLNTLGSYMYSGAGASFQFGEAPTPNSPWPKSSLSSYRRVIDFDAGGSLETFARIPDASTHPAEPQPEGNGQSETRRIPFVEPYGQRGKQFDIWMTPIGFLKRALNSDPSVRYEMVAGKPFSVVSFIDDKKYTITGYINNLNLLDHVETRIDNPALGDVLVESVYSDYRDFQHGLVFPSKMIQKQGGYPILDLAITSAVPNVVAAVIEPLRFYTLGIGEPRYHGPFLGTPPPTSVDRTLVGEGVYFLTGGTEHSVVVEFNDYLVVIEAPLDEARSSAVIAELRTLFGTKPIRYVINTHAHLVAAGGLRTYTAEGAIIITQEINRPYLEKILALPRTISPDRLSQTNKKLLIQGVAEKRVLTDGTHVIELHHLQNGHADGMLVAYLPKEKILVESELYVARDPEVLINEKGEISTLPKAPVSPYASALVTSLDRLKIDYQTVLALQGRAALKSELLEDVKRSSHN